MSVIVSLTLVGSATADFVLPNPEKIVATAETLAGDAASVPSLDSGAVEGLGLDGEDCENPVESQLLETGRIDCGPDPENTPDPGPGDEEPPASGDPGVDAPSADTAQESADGLVTGTTDTAESESSGLIWVIWQPIQEAGQEATRVVQGAYTAASGLVGTTAQAAYESTAGATTMALALTGEALEMATEQVEGIAGYASALLEDLLDMEGEKRSHGSKWAETSGSSAAVEVPETTSLAIGMILASGLGLALAGLAALRKLLGLGSITLLSRIPSSQIMKSGTRGSLYEIVRTDPGVSLNEVVERVGLSRNAVAYHLAVFESEKLMTSVKDGKYRRYFINGGRYVNGAKDVVAAIKNDRTLDVIRYIQQNPGAIQKDVCSAVGTSPSATSWHIKRLERVGLVEKQRVANMVQYKPGPNMERYDLSEFGLASHRVAAPHVAVAAQPA